MTIRDRQIPILYMLPMVLNPLEHLTLLTRVLPLGSLNLLTRRLVSYLSGRTTASRPSRFPGTIISR